MLSSVALLLLLSYGCRTWEVQPLTSDLLRFRIVY